MTSGSGGGPPDTSPGNLGSGSGALPGADTIAGLATAPGVGAVAVIRVSGPGTRALCEPLVGAWPRPRRASLRRLRDPRGEALDESLVLWFPGPASFTGEDMLELHTHGGRLVPRRVLEALVACGVRLAEPGEFSRRALYSGKASLDQLEAVQELVTAEDEGQAAAALYQVQGGLRRRIRGLREALVDLAALFEANLDHPEEDLPELDTGALLADLEGIRSEVAGLAASYERTRLQREGVRVALLGRPNAGKSSLLNALLREERAIVTPEAGTTRDVVEETLVYQGRRFLLLDTAGLRETASLAEAEGVNRARQVARGADLRVLVVPSTDPSPDLGGLGIPEVDLLVWSKLDLLGDASPPPPPLEDGSFPVVVGTAALRDQGIAELLEVLGELAESRSPPRAPGEVLVTNLRHREALEQAAGALEACSEALLGGLPWDLAVTDLYRAIEALGGITGAVVTEDVLDRIFQRFCLGK